MAGETHALHTELLFHLGRNKLNPSRPIVESLIGFVESKLRSNSEGVGPGELMFASQGGGFYIQALCKRLMTKPEKLPEYSEEMRSLLPRIGAIAADKRCLDAGRDAFAHAAFYALQVPGVASTFQEALDILNPLERLVRANRATEFAFQAYTDSMRYLISVAQSKGSQQATDGLLQLLDEVVSERNSTH